MWERLLDSQAFAAVASAFITAAGGVAVVWAGRRKASAVHDAKPKDSAPDGWQGWVDDLRGQVTALREESDKKTTALQLKIDELEAALNKSESLSQRRLERLLMFSRQYNEDISDVIQ